MTPKWRIMVIETWTLATLHWYIGFAYRAPCLFANSIYPHTNTHTHFHCNCITVSPPQFVSHSSQICGTKRQSTIGSDLNTWYLSFARVTFFSLFVWNCLVFTFGKMIKKNCINSCAHKWTSPYSFSKCSSDLLILLK